MFGREVVDEVVDGEAPHADVAVGGAGREHFLRGIQRQALDGGVVSLERVTQLVLTQVENAHVTLLTTWKDKTMKGRDE